MSPNKPLTAFGVPLISPVLVLNSSPRLAVIFISIEYDVGVPLLIAGFQEVISLYNSPVIFLSVDISIDGPATFIV